MTFRTSRFFLLVRIVGWKKGGVVEKLAASPRSLLCFFAYLPTSTKDLRTLGQISQLFPAPSILQDPVRCRVTQNKCCFSQLGGLYRK